MLSKINDPKNLLPLCPNCHWEYDNGIIKALPIGLEPTSSNYGTSG